MIKQLTSIEVLQTKTKVTYYKVYFDTQWFMVTPWHYNKASLMPIFELISKSEINNSYDIKWRVATIGSNKVTLLTQYCAQVTEEFSWDGEEQGAELKQEFSNKASNHIASIPTPVIPAYIEEFESDWDDGKVPF